MRGGIERMVDKKCKMYEMLKPVHFKGFCTLYIFAIMTAFTTSTFNIVSWSTGQVVKIGNMSGGKDWKQDRW